MQPRSVSLLMLDNETGEASGLTVYEDGREPTRFNAQVELQDYQEAGASENPLADWPADVPTTKSYV